MGETPLKEELRFSIEVFGEQYVMTIGTTMMLKLYVNNLDGLMLYQLYRVHLVLEKVVALYGLMM